MKNIKWVPFCLAAGFVLSCSVFQLALIPQTYAAEEIQYISTEPGEVTRQNKADVRGVRGLRGVRGVRGVRGACKQLQEDFVLRVLVPERTGRSLDAQPTLYWFVSQALADAEFTFILDKVPQAAHFEFSEPLIKTDLKLSVQPGIQSLSLHQVLPPDKSSFQLEKDVEYRWTLLLTCHLDYPSLDIKSTGTIKRIEPSPELLQEIEQSPQEKLSYLYAKQGLWYNALDILSQQINQLPNNKELRKVRATLLKQVGLPEVAAYDM